MFMFDQHIFSHNGSAKYLELEYHKKKSDFEPFHTLLYLPSLEYLQDYGNFKKKINYVPRALCC